jgi:DNA-directed RNA polymerase subunit N (RpoN/RPB10)
MVVDAQYIQFIWKWLKLVRSENFDHLGVIRGCCSMLVGHISTGLVTFSVDCLYF